MRPAHWTDCARCWWQALLSAACALSAVHNYSQAFRYYTAWSKLQASGCVAPTLDRHMLRKTWQGATLTVSRSQMRKGGRDAC